MKKIILSLALIFAVSITTFAQPGRPAPRREVRRHYRTAPAPRPQQRQQPSAPYFDGVGEVRLHVAGELGFTDLGGIFLHEAPYHFSAGLMAEVQTGRLLSLGLGTEYYATRNVDYNAMQRMDPMYFSSLPIYANVRLSTPGHGAKFFVEARAGYAVPLNTVGIGNSYYETKGFFTGGGIGLSAYGNNVSIGVNAIDINDYDGAILLNMGPGYGDSHIITDFYIRYSYAIPLH